MTRAWAHRIYKEVIDLEFKLGAIPCVFDVIRKVVIEKSYLQRP